ncbi:hypothetical protein [Frigoriglobus tundricola]|uniref:Uncharacterized protein n=1 Tax=Frigoriglobus tundricola TaxID=2774151 RepID=A0A6M5YJ90_9BACT|nr:hypothetical protein [Frigoriglobus tundricola]QJW93333.1 hypothetical protein FTUN_0839 [Frigoriglobus tundricola]
MLTPRRTMLLLAGFICCGCAYAGYAQLLGWLDGLPQLPAKFTVPGRPIFLPPDTSVSPAQRKLALAFGPQCPETNYALYPTQLEFPGSSVVLASGPVPAKPDSKRVPLSPFSLAVFGKPKPPHLCQPGEVTEITTIHADRAILEFDQVIRSPNDMQTAKLVRLELVSDFNALDDKRRGYVVITNNQKVADENRQLVLRTPGPVFYRDPKVVAGRPEAQGPDLWTDGPVEIVDKQNLPRPIGVGAPITVPANAAETRTSAAVGEILSGRRAPPPTVTAVGMRVYLEPEPPPGQPKPAKGNGPMQGIRKLEFLEQVVVHLWVDGNQSIGGPATVPPAPAGPQDPPPSALALTPPPAAVAAVTGGMGPAGYTARLMSRALLQVDTRGPFAYDAEKSLARFDVVPHSDPNLPNDVQVTKVPARAGATSLFSEVLELELNGGPTAAGRSDAAPPFKRVHAWTYTPGRFLTAAAQDEAMEAYGQDLVHDQAESRTILKGAPLIVVRDQNVLTAGAAQRPATLTSEPGPGSGPARKTKTTVQGPGRVDLFDQASNATTMTATWQLSMVQTKELIKDPIGEREQDLFTLSGDAKFEDTRAEYWLKGDILKLWLEAQPDPAEAGAKPTPAAGARADRQRAASAQPKPARVHAIGHVTSHSSDYDIERAEQLNVFISDPKPAAHAAVAAPVSPSQPRPGPAGPAGPPAPESAPVAAKPAASGAPAVAVAPTRTRPSRRSRRSPSRR